MDYDSEDSLVAALKGNDFFIITLSVTVPHDTEAKLLAAAAKAGVPYVMPNHYGGDIQNEKLIQEYSFSPGWTVRKNQIEGLGLNWITLCCNFWYEHSIAVTPEAYGFDFKNHVMTFYDDGNARINTSTHEQCGRAMAALLSLPLFPQDEHDTSVTISRWINKPLYISSWLVSQRDIFASILRAFGETEKDWKIVHEPSERRWTEGQAQMRAGGPAARVGYVKAMYARVFFPNGDGNFEDKYGLANEALSLPKESMEDHSKIVKEMVENNWSYWG